MLLAFQFVGVAAAPLKVTPPVLSAWLDPKFEPTIVTEVPTPPKPGDTLLTMGAVLRPKLMVVVAPEVIELPVFSAVT
jgi:hypothetical protein